MKQLKDLMKITDGLCCAVSDNDGYDTVQYGVMYGHRVVRDGGGVVVLWLVLSFSEPSFFYFDFV